ncbi:hypothetical protein K1719_021413 [Acacia pycnantha]|nr:hypothetical protein K1719_021413 [Acacia pycnantha]
MYLNDCPSSSGPRHCLFTHNLGRFSFEPMSENPLLGPRIDTLRKIGGLDKDLILEKHQVWRYVSCIFLHAGVIHLLLNMFSLLIIGIGLEREFGFLRIGLLYVLSGFGGSLVSVMRMKGSSQHLVSVGASGALFGLLGSMLSELVTNWSVYTNKCSTLMVLVVVIVLNLAVGFLPKVDNSAHIGGFISGFLLGFVFLMRPQYGYMNQKHIPTGYQAKQKSKHSLCQYFFFLIALILAILGYAFVLAQIYVKLPKKFDATQIFPK